MCLLLLLLPLLPALPRRLPSTVCSSPYSAWKEGSGKDSAPPLGSGRNSAVPPANGAGGSASRPEGGLGSGIFSAVRGSDARLSSSRVSLFYSNVSYFGKEVKEYYSKESAHILAAIEHRLDRDQLLSLHPDFTAWNRTPFAQPAVRTGDHVLATSGGVLLLPRSHLATAAVDNALMEHVLVGQSTATRWTCMVLRTKSVSILLVFLYLFTSQGLSDQNLQIISQVLNLAALFPGEVIIGGDWNLTPHELFDCLLVQFSGLKLVTPGDFHTCTAGPKRQIDYFLASPGIAPFMSCEVEFQVKWKPHLGLRVTFPARLRQFVSPKVSTPKPLPPLPIDPDLKVHVFREDLWTRAEVFARSHIDRYSAGTGILGCNADICGAIPPAQIAVSKQYSEHVTAMEVYSCLASGLQEHAVKPFIGRSSLPHVSLKPTIQRLPKAAQFSSPHVDLWARIECLLSWLSGDLSGVMERHLVQPISALISLAPKIDASWRRNAAPNCPVSAWQSWISGLSPERILNGARGYTQSRVQTFIERAVAQRAKAISAMESDRKERFKRWLEQDLSNGAAGAHRLVKEKTYADFAPKLPEFDVWGRLWRNAAHFDTSDAEVTWMDAGVGFFPWIPWKSQLTRFFLSNPVHTRFIDETVAQHQNDEHLENVADLPSSFLQLCSGESVLGGFSAVKAQDVQSAAESYPAKKALGIDAMPVKHTATMPLEILQGTATTLNMVQLAVRWPIQIMLNLVALLPKRLGGSRAVSKTPMLYRLWSIIRSPTLKAWASEHTSGWDFAAAGRSALYSGSVRCFNNEVALASGLHASNLLWDVDKFFDSIMPRLVMQEGLRMGYPLIDLLLALRMHCAARVLVYRGFASPLMQPLLSILAGCFHSMFFARMVFDRPISRVVSDVKTVRTTSFVDDVGQSAIGTLKRVAYDITQAGVAFAAGMRAIRLKISPKSVVVSSSPRISTIVANTLKRISRVTISVDSAARDLGLWNNPSGRRSTVLQQERLRTAKVRLKKISKLAKTLRKANVLAYTGALPQALWGAASLGVSPSAMQSLVASTAAATGITAAGRCPATAISIVMGISRHPIISTSVQQVGLFLDLWNGEHSLRALAVRHWKSLHERVVHKTDDGVQVKHSMVVGPVTATISLLTSQGWNLADPGRWTDPSGFQWTPDPNADKLPFLRLVERFAAADIWKAADASWCGLGLSSGVCWQATLALRAHISKVNDDDFLDLQIDPDDHPDASSSVWPERALVWLDLLLTGGYWPQWRSSLVHGHSAACPRCGAPRETACHLLWACPANAAIKDHRVQSTQKLMDTARQQAHDLPCLWLRGMLPASLTVVNTPFPDEVCLNFVGCEPFEEWPAGRYFSDGSGGRFNTYPILRRCGFGVAYLVQSPSAYTDLDARFFKWGVFGAVTGEIQTVPRAELFAISVIVMRVQPGRTVICTDSKVCFDTFQLGKQHCLRSPHADLWKSVWDVLDQGLVQLSLRWVKAHGDRVNVMAAYRLQPWEVIGNCVADALAERGSSIAEVWAHDSAGILFHYSLVRQIQARAIVILSTVLTTRMSQLAGKRKLASLSVKALSSFSNLLSTRHKFTCIGPVLHCYVCNQRSPWQPHLRKQWLATECRPDAQLQKTIQCGSLRPTPLPPHAKVRVGRVELHASHRIEVYQGLYFCSLCGYVASSKAQHLAVQCTRSSINARRRVALLRAGKLPSNMVSWPNARPSRELSLISLGDA